MDDHKWVQKEVKQNQFSNKRLGIRFGKILEQLARGFGRSIPFACQDWGNTKAAYRFLSNERVNETEILGGQ